MAEGNRRLQGRRAGLVVVAALLALVACKPKEDRLEGERLGLRDYGAGQPLDATAASAEAASRARPISLPAPGVNAEWTHRNGSATHRLRHPALAPAPALVWSADIGKGNSRRGRITADPIVAGGRVFTLDAAATVTATSTTGQPLWSRDLTPPGERAGDASGGALAYGGGKVFVTTGFGSLSALDPATGAVVWSQNLDAVAAGAPTVLGDLVYVTARDSRAWAIRAGDGRVEWQLPGTPTPSVMEGGAGPAVTGRLAIFPFGSGELVATLRRGGIRIWAATVAGSRTGQVYATISDITGDPVVDGNTVYVGNQSGRTVALNLASGERRWTANHGAYSPVWPEGGSVFLVSDLGKLVRLDAATGAEIWQVDLPYFERPGAKRRRDVTANFGPVLAGGRLWVASDDGNLRGFDPVNGALLYQTAIPGGAASNMAVAGGMLYLVSARGQLLAFR